MAVQEYTPTLWEDAPSSETPINAENLNHIESGIVNATGAIQDLENSALSMQDVENKIYEIVDSIFSSSLLNIDYIDGAYWLNYTDSDGTTHKLKNVSAIIQNETAGKFVPAQTISSLDEATELGVLYKFSNQYYFNVSDGASLWTQYQIGMGNGTIREHFITYRTRSRSAGQEWGAYSAYYAFENRAVRATAITDANKGSNNYYATIKAIVDYIAAQG